MKYAWVCLYVLVNLMNGRREMKFWNDISKCLRKIKREKGGINGSMSGWAGNNVVTGVVGK